MDYRTVTTNGQFQAYRQSLSDRGFPPLVLDIEAEFNLHVYGERLCLVQINDGKELIAVDPVGIDGALLREFFEERRLLKIMYDSLSDQALLFKTIKARIHSILDLKPAVDLLGYERRDLGSVLVRSLGITIEKKSRFQRYNWTVRPLAADALEYALSDVAHLFRLKEKLLDELAAGRLLDGYIHKNMMLQSKAPDVERRPRLFRSTAFRNLPAEARDRFERIYELRDGYARTLDLPPDIVLPKQQLFQIASGRIRTDQLEPNRRMPGRMHRKLIVEIEALIAGLGASRP